MKYLRLLRIISCFLLLCNGCSAVYGGLSLMFHPDGSGLHLDPILLAHTPFNDYMIPGTVLFIVNGLFSLTALLLTATNYRNYERYITLQGALLLGWLLIQVLLIRTLDVVHLIMAIVGTGLVIGGAAISRIKALAEHAWQ